MLIELTDNELKAIQDCIEMAHMEGYWGLTESITRAEFNAMLMKVGFNEDDVSYYSLKG